MVYSVRRKEFVVDFIFFKEVSRMAWRRPQAMILNSETSFYFSYAREMSKMSK